MRRCIAAHLGHLAKSRRKKTHGSNMAEARCNHVKFMEFWHPRYCKQLQTCKSQDLKRANTNTKHHQTSGCITSPHLCPDFSTRDMSSSSRLFSSTSSSFRRRCQSSGSALPGLPSPSKAPVEVDESTMNNLWRNLWHNLWRNLFHLVDSTLYCAY